MATKLLVVLTLVLFQCPRTSSWNIPSILTHLKATSTASTSLASAPNLAPFLLPLQLSFSLVNPLNQLNGNDPPQPPITNEVYGILKSNYLRASSLPPPPSNPTSNHFLSTLESKNYLSTLNDKYTRLLSPQAYAEIQKYDLTGLGLLLQVYRSSHPLDDVDDGLVYVSSPPVRGGAADKAGLESGDIITRVNGMSVKGKTAMEVVSMITEKGDVAELDVKGKGVVDVERRFEFRQTVAGGRGEGGDFNVKIPDFNGRTYEGVKGALAAAADEDIGVRRVTLDLRGNTGGSFQSAVDVAGLFVPGGTVAKVRDGRGETMDVRAGGAKGSKPAAEAGEGVRVLIDERTASASEVSRCPAPSYPSPPLIRC